MDYSNCGKNLTYRPKKIVFGLVFCEDGDCYSQYLIKQEERRVQNAHRENVSTSSSFV
jgi:hypothetical protein